MIRRRYGAAPDTADVLQRVIANGSLKKTTDNS